jgi:hypothetical protein
MKLELAVAAIAGVVSVASATMAYVAQDRATTSQKDVAALQQASQQAHERQQPFIDAQMRYYFEAAETAAQIPRSEGSARDKLARRFWQLYWGPMAVVEDQEVEKAMVAYGRQLRIEPADSAMLENLSLGVARACRSSLQRLWVQNLGDVHNIRPASE